MFGRDADAGVAHAEGDSSPRLDRVNRHLPPGSVYFTAFSIRFATT
jgi:hypothetical protein